MKEEELTKEQKQKIYERWLRAIEKSRIPVSCRNFDAKDMKRILCGKEAAVRDVIYLIYRYVHLWERGSSFVIDGNGAMDGLSSADIRRRLGSSVLQNGVTKACQSPQFCPPYGMYIDYKNFLTKLMNKEESAEFIDNVCSQEFLFISEIYFAPGKSDLFIQVTSERVDEIIRRRRDEGLSTIMSFTVPCMNINNIQDYGEEISDIVGRCKNFETQYIADLNIVRLTT